MAINPPLLKSVPRAYGIWITDDPVSPNTSGLAHWYAVNNDEEVWSTPNPKVAQAQIDRLVLLQGGPVTWRKFEVKEFL